METHTFRGVMNAYDYSWKRKKNRKKWQLKKRSANKREKQKRSKGKMNKNVKQMGEQAEREAARAKSVAEKAEKETARKKAETIYKNGSKRPAVSSVVDGS